MADARGTYAGWRDDADDGWGPSTSVRSSGGSPPTVGRRVGRTDETTPSDRARPRGAAAAGTREVNGSAGATGHTAVPPAATRRAAVAADSAEQPQFAAVPERGLPGWGALLVLVGIAGLGGLIDMLRGTHVRGAFNIAIVIAALVAIVVVRRSSLFTVVVAPPIVYTAATLGTIYIRSGGLKDKKVLFDSAASWLVYGFPAIAAATAAVLIVAGLRLIIRK